MDMRDTQMEPHPRPRLMRSLAIGLALVALPLGGLAGCDHDGGLLGDLLEDAACGGNTWDTMTWDDCEWE